MTGKRLTLAAVAIGVGFLVSIWSVHRLYVAESRLKVLLPSAVPGDPTRRELGRTAAVVVAWALLALLVLAFRKYSPRLRAALSRGGRGSRRVRASFFAGAAVCLCGVVYFGTRAVSSDSSDDVVWICIGSAATVVLVRNGMRST